MVRLSEHEIDAIKSSVEKFDPEAKVYLFGSRKDATQKGGDIDLLVLSEKLSNDHRLEIKYEIFKLIEEQKIDLIIADNTDDPFVKIALSEGIQL